LSVETICVFGTPLGAAGDEHAPIMGLATAIDAIASPTVFRVWNRDEILKLSSSDRRAIPRTVRGRVPAERLIVANYAARGTDLSLRSSYLDAVKPTNRVMDMSRSASTSSTLEMTWCTIPPSGS